MAVTIPPPPNVVADFDHQWKDWLFTMWRRVKGLEPGETGGGDSNAFHSNVDGEFFTLGGLGVGVDADLIVLEDASDGYSKVGMTLLNFRRLEDNIKWKYGTGDDSEVYYDGTNLVINPKVIGTGLLDVSGTVRSDGRIEQINTTPKTANYAVTVTDENILCDTSGGAFTVTLPASPEDGRVYTVILETAGNVLTIDGNGKNVDGNTTGTLDLAGDAIQLIYNGTQWSPK